MRLPMRQVCPRCWLLQSIWRPACIWGIMAAAAQAGGMSFGNIDMSKQGTAPQRLIGAGRGEGMDITPAKPNGRLRKAC